MDGILSPQQHQQLTRGVREVGRKIISSGAAVAEEEGAHLHPPPPSHPLRSFALPFRPGLMMLLPCHPPPRDGYGDDDDADEDDTAILVPRVSFLSLYSWGRTDPGRKFVPP